MELVKLISASCKQALDQAIDHELYASNFYKNAANHMQRIGYFGAQKFFVAESASELEHYQKIVDFLNDVGMVAKVPSVEAMTEQFSSLLEVVQAAYNIEVALYHSYSRWYKSESDDPVVQQFLLQFLEIQRTSVGEYGDLLSRLKLAGDDKCALLIIDQEMGG